MSKKLITPRARQACEYEQTVYKVALSTINDPRMFCFVNKTSVGQNACRRRRGYSPKGTSPTGLEFFTGTDEHSGSTYTLIGAVDINGFVELACQAVWRKGSGNNPAHGTVNAEFFTEWVRYSLVPTLGKFEDREARSVVVMDYATIRNPGKVVEIIEKAGAKVIWTPAYSPELNPIEKCFNNYKKWIKLHWRIFLGDAVLMDISALRMSVTRDNMIRFYGSKDMEGCIRNLPLTSGEKRKRERRLKEQLLANTAAGFIDGPLNMSKVATLMALGIIDGPLNVVNKSALMLLGIIDGPLNVFKR